MRFLLICIAGIVIAITAPAIAQEQPGEAAETAQLETFDASAAWSEFEGILRGLYAYIERDDIDVDAQLARSKAAALQTKDPAQIRRVMHQTALTFMDPHLIVGPFADDDYAIVMTSSDMDILFINSEAAVRDVRRGSPAFEAGIRPGDVIEAIDGLKPAEAARLPFGSVLPNPNAAQMDYGLLLAVNGKRGSGRILRVRRGADDARIAELISTSKYATSLNDRELVTAEFVGEDQDVAVLRVLNSLGNNDTIRAFDEAMAKAKGAKAIILDMRDTPSGGNTEVARSIIGHFTSEVRPYQMHVVPVFEREFTVPRQFVEYVHPREPFFEGPVYVLHGRWTGSMGEGIVIGMDAAADNAVTVGSDMGDLLGGLWNRDLSQIKARLDVGGEALFHVDGTPREDYVADLPTAPVDTAGDGSDPGIAAVLRILAEN